MGLRWYQLCVKLAGVGGGVRIERLEREWPEPTGDVVGGQTHFIPKPGRDDGWLQLPDVSEVPKIG